MTPDVDLMRLYGTEVVFREKNASGVPPLPMRILNAILQQQLAKGGIAQHEGQKAHDEQRNRAIQALVALELAQANNGMRHSRVPLILGAGRPGQGEFGNDQFPFSDIAPMMSGSSVPLGLDEGMVRMASQVIGAGADLAYLDKEAGPTLGGLGQALGNAGRSLAGGVAGLGKKLTSTAATAATAAPKLAPTMAMSPKSLGVPFAKTMPAPSAAPTVGMGPTPTGTTGRVMGVSPGGSVNPTLMEAQQSQRAYSQLPQQARGALEAHPLVQQHGVPPHIAAFLAQASAKPGESAAAAVSRHAAMPMSAAKPPVSAAPTAASIAKPAPSATPPPISAAAPATPPPAAKPASPGVPPKPAGAPAQPPGSPPPSQPPAQAAPGAPKQPGTLQRIGNDLGGGKWKYKLPMLGAAAVGTYGAYKGLQKGLEYMSGEAQPRKFNEGAPQMAYGVNEYGYPQLGTPLQ